MGKRVLYIGMEVLGAPKTGGEYGQIRNRNMLKALFDEVIVVEIPKIGLFGHLVNLVLGRSYGYTRALRGTIDECINNGTYDFAFVDSSSYGGYVGIVAKNRLKSVVFCHNVEYDYYKAKYQSKKSFMNWILVHYIHRQEHLSIKNATKVVALNERDKKEIDSIYHRSADLVLPVFYEAIEKNAFQKQTADYLLFVGANFYANNDGIEWFIKNVSPYISSKVCIAGGCCDYIRNNINIAEYGNVSLLGFVDDLDSLYKAAAGVICPIFSGSGMKTKTIEALRFGRTVFGTSEAFEGIDVDYSKIGGLCNTSEEFIHSINKYNNREFNEYSYHYFVNHFSTKAVYPKFADFVSMM